MPMISIKRYLDFPAGQKLQRVVAILAETVTRGPVEVDLSECERFQEEIACIQNRFPAEASVEQLHEAANEIANALERHNRVVGGLIRGQESELQSMIGMLTYTLRSLGSASETSVKNLDSIASQLKHASALGDMRELRLRLDECLKNVRSEAARQKHDNQEKMHVLSEGLSATQQRLSAHGIEADVDRVTGFAGRNAAEVAIHEATNRQETHYVVVAVLSKLQAVNLRFGYSVGDEVLCEFAARVAGSLCNDAQFYRWNGPTLIAILKRTEPLHVLRAEVGRILEEPIVKSLAGGTQNAFITLSATSLVLALARPAGDLIKRIDAFVTSQVPHELRSDYGDSPQGTN